MLKKKDGKKKVLVQPNTTSTTESNVAATASDYVVQRADYHLQKILDGERESRIQEEVCRAYDEKLANERDQQTTKEKEADLLSEQRLEIVDKRRAESRARWPLARAHMWDEEGIDNGQMRPIYHFEPESYELEWQQGRELYWKRLEEFSRYLQQKKSVVKEANNDEQPLLTPHDIYERLRETLPLPNDCLLDWPHFPPYLETKVERALNSAEQQPHTQQLHLTAGSAEELELTSLLKQAMEAHREMYWQSVAAGGALAKFRRRYDEMMIAAKKQGTSETNTNNEQSLAYIRPKRSRRQVVEESVDFDYVYAHVDKRRRCLKSPPRENSIEADE